MKVSHNYSDLDSQTRQALGMSRDDLVGMLGDRLTIHQSNESMIAGFAQNLLDDYVTALKKGRERGVFIVPVGPVGQYPILAELSRKAQVSLKKMTLIVMDEYLTDQGKWIDESDPLSFRSHIKRHLLTNLPVDDQPEVLVPDPFNPDRIGARIAECGVVDVTYAGVGITGHLAFNEPMEGVTDANFFAALPTRVVPLLRETRLINAVTACRGNVSRVPRLAVTVGMKEILSANKLRIFMNRHWQSAAIRKLAFGTVTPAFPASLVQTHPDWSITLVEHVLESPEPVLA